MPLVDTKHSAHARRVKRRLKTGKVKKRVGANEQGPPALRIGQQLLKSSFFEIVFALVILGNFVLVVLETDAIARDEEPPMWIEVLGWAVLASFTFEVGLRVVVLGQLFWIDGVNVADFVLVAVDLALNLLSLSGQAFSISFLRIIRLCKLVRVTKVFKVFPELRLMMAGLMGSVRAIFWGTVLLIFALLMWSVIAVQFIQPLNERIASEGDYSNCDRCSRAYACVASAFLTLSQQIVAGDGWGSPSVIIIEHYPATGMYFGAVYLTVGLAAMNLILGVVVEVASQARNDLTEEMEDEDILESMQSKTSLVEMFESMDLDADGEISKEELFSAYENNESFNRTIADMDLTEEDMNVLWVVLDSGRSGAISYMEFVTNVYKMKSSSTNFMLAYVKYYVTEIKHKICTQLEDTKNELIKNESLFRDSIDAAIEKSMAPSSMQLFGSPPTAQDLLVRRGRSDLQVASASRGIEQSPDVRKMAEQIQTLIASLNTELEALTVCILRPRAQEASKPSANTDIVSVQMGNEVVQNIDEHAELAGGKCLVTSSIRREEDTQCVVSI